MNNKKHKNITDIQENQTYSLYCKKGEVSKFENIYNYHSFYQDNTINCKTVKATKQ